MKVTLSPRRLAGIRADVLVVAAGADWKARAVAPFDRALQRKLIAELTSQRFQGRDGDVALFQTHGALAARYIVLVGIGAAAGTQPWYKLAHTAVTQARELKAASAAIAAVTAELSPNTIETIAEGVLLSAYQFEHLKTAPPRRTPRLRHLTIVAGSTARLQAAVARAQTVAAAACYARDLVNLPAATVTPAYLANQARRIARAQGLRLRVLGARAIKRAGMGGLLGVSQGSAQPPRFIELRYQPRRISARKRVALAGKGITFDSGGLSIKNADAMQSQKRDMAGAAAVLAVMSVARDLAIPIEVRAYIPATENMPGGRALKPGDVVRAYNGKTIEVLNTDAEGRLVLADALAVAAAAKPDIIIDLATLTAAVRQALGNRYAAIMGTDRAVVQALIAAGHDCGEHLWELPLVADYRADIESSVADIKNVGEGAAGTIIGGLFLKEFVGTIPWAHIDFSSTVVTDKAFPCHPRGATGFGVRTLLRYLSQLTG